MTTPLTAQSEPDTEAGREFVQWWLDGRTHPPSTPRRRDFVGQVRRVEAAARAPLVEALRALFAPTASIEGDCAVSTEDGECLWCDSGEVDGYPLPMTAHEVECPWLEAKSLLARHAPAAAEARLHNWDLHGHQPGCWCHAPAAEGGTKAP